MAIKIGKKLTELRNKKHLTQQQMAEYLEIKRERYSAWENEISQPKMGMLQKIAKFHKIQLSYFFEEDSEIVEENKIENTSKDDSNQFEEFINNPEHGLFFRDYLEAPEERKKELMQFWRFIQEKEKDRKPGDHQGE